MKTKLNVATTRAYSIGLLILAACSAESSVPLVSKAPRAKSVAASEAPPTRPAVRVVTGSGYASHLTLEEQRDFKGATQIFTGVVESVSAPRHVANGYVEYVYSPVVVRVIRVIRGKEASGSTVTLRAFGGTADGVEFRTDAAPAPEVLKQGTRLLVFGPDTVVVEGDEPMAALTPNGVFVIANDAVVDATSARHEAQGARANMRVAAAESILGASLRD